MSSPALAATVLAATTGTRVVFAMLIAAAVLAFSMALMFMSRDRRGKLEARIADYAQATPDEIEEFDPFTREDATLAETAVMKRMVGITGRLAERAGLLARTEDALEQADLPLRPPEALFFYFAGLVTIALFGFLVMPLGMAFVLVAVSAVIPVGVLQRRRTKRLRSFQLQLPDTLNLLSGSMRAGFSFAQGLESVANEATEPTRRELQRVFTESRLGRPIEDALEDSANRMHSIDLIWAVMAIRIQREVGGNLAELLDTVAHTMTDRERMKREILALTAEGRLSAWILGIFPPAFAVVLYIVQPKYMVVLFQTGIGIMAVIASAVLACFGFWWLRTLMRIEV